MKVFSLLLFLALLLIGLAIYWVTRMEIKEESEIKQFEKVEPKVVEKPDITPPTPLGYGRGGNYTEEIKIKPDIALLYTYSNPLPLHEVGLKGVWFIERDRITSLSDDGILSIHFQAPRAFIELSGQSVLPVRIELNNKSAGEFWIDGKREYEFALPDKSFIPHTLTLHVPRGVSAYSFRFTE